MIDQDERANAFEIRRALRASYTCLWVYIESRVNFALYSAITGHLFKVKKVMRLEGDEVLRFKRLARLSWDIKLELLELIAGTSLCSGTDLQGRLQAMSEIRNDILHSGHYDSNLFKKNAQPISNEEFFRKLSDGMETARAFIAILHKNELTSKDEFLANEEPVKLTEQGLGYQPPKGSRDLSRGESILFQ